MKITDEAIAAARAEMRPFVPPNDETLRRAIAAALAVQTQQGVEVKKLDWSFADNNGVKIWTARDSFGNPFEHLTDCHGWWSSWRLPAFTGKFENQFATAEEGKAAAQSDYETRIRSALVDVPAVESEPVGEQWCAYEDGHQHTSWYPDRYGDRAGWAALAKRNPEKYQVVTRPVYARPPRSLSNEGWMPIETAPKDGTEILLAWQAVAVPEKGAEWFQTVGRWDGAFEYIGEDASEYRGAWTDDAVASWAYQETRELTPTHWQPLPTPPLSTRKGSAGDGAATITSGGSE